ncbi:hypothetical protein N0V93_002310 [Gnomoniopsis smithogilvyi]|uniref:Uncharacterized protein n=1 Tax=Gnomoniopsis smithogilvyi TaxID=1191159 RepID=A0A9W9CYY5_9PEZI|nr:hypothetical protein N0V93_002310 [Gnomoniopsis smithogilvyi]
MTPQLCRLKTPELEPLNGKHQFCMCYRARERSGQLGREKMDVQLEAALAHIRETSRRPPLGDEKRVERTS